MTQNPKSVTNGCKPDRKPPAEDVEFLVGSKTSVGGTKKEPEIFYCVLGSGYTAAHAAVLYVAG
jgi:hypothetical protein